jgi:hypothetical protein
MFRTNSLCHLVTSCHEHLQATHPDIPPEALLAQAREETATAILEHLEHPAHAHPEWYSAHIASYLIHDIEKSMAINRDRWKTFIEMLIVPGDTLLVIYSVVGKVL